MAGLLTNTVQEALMRWHHPDNYVDEPRNARRSGKREDLDRLWQQSSGARRDGPSLLAPSSALPTSISPAVALDRNQARPAPPTQRETLRRVVRRETAYQRMRSPRYRAEVSAHCCACISVSYFVYIVTPTQRKRCTSASQRLVVAVTNTALGAIDVHHEIRRKASGVLRGI